MVQLVQIESVVGDSIVGQIVRDSGADCIVNRLSLCKPSRIRLSILYGSHRLYQQEPFYAAGGEIYSRYSLPSIDYN